MSRAGRSDTSPNKGPSIRVSPSRRRVVFHGRVQGVGFRAAVQELATAHPVSGFVRNLSDGTVEFEAQGDSREIDRLMARIGERFERNIESAEICEVPRVDGESGFGIRR